MVETTQRCRVALTITFAVLVLAPGLLEGGVLGASLPSGVIPSLWRVAREYGTIATVPSTSGSLGSVSANIVVGDSPYGMAYDSSTHRLYVANSNDVNLSVIDTNTNVVTGSVQDLGDGNWAGPTGVAYDSANGQVYVTVPTAGNRYSTGAVVAVVDTNNNSVIGWIHLPAARDIVYDGNTGDLYVDSDLQDGLQGIEIISGGNDSVVGFIPVHGGAGPMALDPGNHDLYVTTAFNSLLVVSDTTNSVIGNITVGLEPYGVVAVPSLGRVFVANVGSTNLTVISTLTNTVSATIPGVGSFGGLAYDSRNGAVYVADSLDGRVTGVDGTTGAVLGTIQDAVGGPWALLYDTDNGNMYVSNPGSNTISVITEVAPPSSSGLLGLPNPWGTVVLATVAAAAGLGVMLAYRRRSRGKASRVEPKSSDSRHGRGVM